MTASSHSNPESTASQRRSSERDEDAFWELVAERIDALAAAWDELSDVVVSSVKFSPPDLRSFATELSEKDNRLLLIELVKTDLEYRWQRDFEPLEIEHYVRDYPELGPVEQLPLELLYEEFQARIQAGSPVYEEEIRDRFPNKADALLELLGGMAISGSPTCTYYRDTRVSTDRPNDTLVGEAVGSQAPKSIQQQLADLKPGDAIEDFQLVASLGSGAFARVFLARQVSMERLVALKISATSGREPQTLAQLDHPNIIRVFDQRECKSPPARLLYMEVAPGGTLHDLLKLLAQKRKSVGGINSAGQALLDSIDSRLAALGMSRPADSSRRERIENAPWVEVACLLGSEIASGLAYAHERGVLHRDIKPANVLLTAEATPKLADFNVSYNGGHAEEDPKDAFGGSLAYMSPEQLEACHPLLGGSPQLVRESADIFAFGVMMWEMLTGKRPFRDELVGSQGGQLARLQRMIEMRRNTDFPEIARNLPDDCPPPLRRTLERCLNPDKKQRYASAEHLAQALRVCLNPRAWKLLEPPKTTIGKFAVGWPVMAIMLAGLLPNVLIAAFNYLYNRLRMSGDWPELYQRFDHVQLVINSVAFPLGIGIMVWSWLMVSRQLKEPPLRERAVHRVLLFGHFVAMVLLLLWSASGAAFPLAIAWGSPLEEGWGFHLHFFTSLAICGLAAIVYPYFLITSLVTRYGVPALVRNEVVAGPAQEDLERLKKLNRVYLALAGLVPLLALLLLAVTGSQQSWALIVASGAGLVGLAAMFWLENQIGLDLEALETIAVD